MLKTEFKKFNPDLELRAFVYQQIQDLEFFAQGLGAVIVKLEESVSEPATYSVTLTIDPSRLNVSIYVEDSNMYLALRRAKSEAKDILGLLLNVLDVARRKAFEHVEDLATDDPVGRNRH